ncbi:MAG: prepilin-type N-terminal cleavage/methylation domain-containing protein [Patescibacteria group bacterium]
MKNFLKKGITVIELLVVLTVLGIIISVAIPQFSQIRENQVFKSGVADILSSIDKARGETLSSLYSSEYGVHFESNKVIIFKGKIFSATASDNETINITLPATISTITIAGGGADLYFNRLSGTPNVTGSIIISSTNFIKTITIFATGMASVN